MRKSAFAAMVVLLVLVSFEATATEPLVEVAWVKARSTAPGFAFLDFRKRESYLEAHIPGAVRSDYQNGGWRQRKGDLPPKAPSPARFEVLAGFLGIDNATHVVIVSEGTTTVDMAAATHVYWTFRIMGHDLVSILNGGMNAYAADKSAPLEKGERKPVRREFRTRFKPELVATEEDVRRARNGGLIVDYRPVGSFLGINKHAAVKRYGTVPGARNLPFGWLTKDNGGLMRSRKALISIYRYAGVPGEGGHIALSDFGTLASLGWFVAHELLGDETVRLYDGGFAEWSLDPANPVERTVNPG